ncbi:MAG: superoxide dismutase [Acidimicrobiaceae bacterium]|nr:superoxide dismutase [Acidimicrobiaceae bacterium]
MTIELAHLPYPLDGLAPHISERTMSFHYGRHHAGYVASVNSAIAGTALEGASLEDIVAAADVPSALFNCSAQSWNHAFYWNSMSPGGIEAPAGDLLAALERSFGSLDAFNTEFAAAAVGNFASGWTWLVSGADGLQIVNTDDADTPLRHGQRALLTIDVWEHAYYLDYQNARAAYVDAFIEHLINWEFASANFAAAG